MNLDEIRTEIDAVDDELTKLLPSAWSLPPRSQSIKEKTQ